MIKRLFYALIILLLILGITYYFNKKNPPSDTQASQKLTAPEINVEDLTINSKKVFGLTPEHEAEEIKKIKLSNTPKDWEEGLQKTLSLQGGDLLKDIKITKKESFIWKQDNIALNVESVVIQLTKDNGEETSFRAMVDSETGKILKTWDQPIIDSASPRDKFKIKIDPRYHYD